MDEEEGAKEVTAEAALKDTDAGDKPKELDPIERANAAAERMEKANEEKKVILRENKEVVAKQILGGQTTASQIPEKKEPVSDVQYYKDVKSGKFNINKE